MSDKPDRLRILLLGGTSEARSLAGRLTAGEAGAVDLTVSLAGRTRHPASMEGSVRLGGFGGVDGLADYLQNHAVDVLVDATHPYAARISANAERACAMQAIPRLALNRPAWRPLPGDAWIEVKDADEAAAALPPLGKRIFLSIGTAELGAFQQLDDTWFLVRTVDEPTAPPPLAACTLIQGRGPFTVADEEALLAAHNIEVVVSKNSGGTGARAKLDAARSRGLPVVMIGRPTPPAPPVVETVEQVIDWLVDNRPV